MSRSSGHSQGHSSKGVSVRPVRSLHFKSFDLERSFLVCSAGTASQYLGQVVHQGHRVKVTCLVYTVHRWPAFKWKTVLFFKQMRALLYRMCRPILHGSVGYHNTIIMQIN